MNKSPERCKILLEKARGDEMAFAQLAKDPTLPDWAAGFHAQQAVEKAFKSVLACKGVDFPFTHNLVRLASLLKEHGLDSPLSADDLANLTPFGAALRYDEESPDPTDLPLDRVWATDAVRRAIQWAEAQTEF